MWFFNFDTWFWSDKFTGFRIHSVTNIDLTTREGKIFFSAVDIWFIPGEKNIGLIETYSINIFTCKQQKRQRMDESWGQRCLDILWKHDVSMLRYASMQIFLSNKKSSSKYSNISNCWILPKYLTFLIWLGHLLSHWLVEPSLCQVSNGDLKFHFQGLP